MHIFQYIQFIIFQYLGCMYVYFPIFKCIPIKSVGHGNHDKSLQFYFILYTFLFNKSLYKK